VQWTTSSSARRHFAGLLFRPPIASATATSHRKANPCFRSRESIRAARILGKGGTRCPTSATTGRPLHHFYRRDWVEHHACKRPANLLGLPPQTSCKHLTIETPRNRAKRPTPIGYTFAAFRPCSPAFADNSLYRGERLELAFPSGFRGARGPICGPHTAPIPGFVPVETRRMPSRTHVCFPSPVRGGSMPARWVILPRTTNVALAALAQRRHSDGQAPCRNRLVRIASLVRRPPHTPYLRVAARRGRRHGRAVPSVNSSRTGRPRRARSRARFSYVQCSGMDIGLLDA